MQTSEVPRCWELRDGPGLQQQHTRSSHSSPFSALAHPKWRATKSLIGVGDLSLCMIRGASLGRRLFSGSFSECLSLPNPPRVLIRKPSVMCICHEACQLLDFRESKKKTRQLQRKNFTQCISLSIPQWYT